MAYIVFALPLSLSLILQFELYRELTISSSTFRIIKYQTRKATASTITIMMSQRFQLFPAIAATPTPAVAIAGITDAVCVSFGHGYGLVVGVSSIMVCRYLVLGLWNRQRCTRQLL